MLAGASAGASCAANATTQAKLNASSARSHRTTKDNKLKSVRFNDVVFMANPVMEVDGDLDNTAGFAGD